MLLCSFQDLLTVTDVYLHRPDLIWTHLKAILMEFYGYVAVIFGFIVFLWYNGSIVIGDKCAHQAVIHVPQVKSRHLSRFQYLTGFHFFSDLLLFLILDDIRTVSCPVETEFHPTTPDQSLVHLHRPISHLCDHYSLQHHRASLSLS